MSIVEAIVLGLVQGLTEFLPISSTAHLTLAGRAMHLIDPANPELWTQFIAVIQLGTLLAVLFYFRKDIISIVRDWFRDNMARKAIKDQSPTSRTGWFIILGTIPVVIIGLALKHIIEGTLTKNLMVIGCSLIALALVLEVAERMAKFERPIDKMTIKDSLLIGFAQCFALIPGASRSGTTITAGLFAGLTREAAARFSFLLSIPAVAASGLLELVAALKHFQSGGLVPMLVATVVAAVSGYAAIAFLLRYLRSHSTRVFIIYRILVGAGILTAIALKMLDA